MGKDAANERKDYQMDEQKQHQMEAPAVAAMYGTSLTEGLTSQQALENLQKYGPNKLTDTGGHPWYMLLWENMTGFFSLLLWAAAFLCFIAYGLDPTNGENLALGIVLAVVVFITGVFSFVQDYNSASTMAKFKNMLPPKTQVIRDNKTIEIEASDLVPGDIVFIESGGKIPADVYIIQASNFKVNNSSLTGESEPLQRKPGVSADPSPTEADNIGFYGTNCESGNAKGIVVFTGDNTYMGTIAHLTAGTNTAEVPINIEIKHFIKIITYVAVFLGLTFLFINVGKGAETVANLVFCIGIIVANVPEGLLATVTVSLSLTAKRMAHKKVLVKNLPAVETLGSTTCIASDKTGTLTQNRMTVHHIYYDNKAWSAAVGAENFNKTDPTFRALQLIACLCNKCIFVKNRKNMRLPLLQRVTGNGNASEAAFIKFCEGISPIEEMRDNYQELADVPFNSTNKYQISINLDNNDWQKPRLVLIKGAPERVWSRCRFIMVNGVPQLKTEEHEKKYQAEITNFMQSGERVLGCAMGTLAPDMYPHDYKYETGDPEKYNFPHKYEDDLCFVGLIALIDPPRTAVPGAVLSCQDAGIKVIMVTGDHPETAEAIAKEVNIIRDMTRRDLARSLGQPMSEIHLNDPRIKAVVITGAELAKMSAKDLDHYLDFDQIVFARTSPKQKLIIVEGLRGKKYQTRGYENNPKRIKHVVAVTGDGVNDSPALTAADIGIAMGIAGSDVAKDAADMILLNDNFASIVDGVEEGRLIFDNLKKSIAYTLSSNIPEISPFLLFILFSIPLPLPTVLILCIDLGTDMVPAISLAYENKEANIMKKKPRDMNTERLVTAKLVCFSYLQVGIMQALAGFFCYFVVLNDYGFRIDSLMGFSTAFEVDFDVNAPNGRYYPKGNITFPEEGLVLTGSEGEDCSEWGMLSAKLGKDSDEITSRCLKKCNLFPSPVCWDPFEALAHAQTSYFISIIVVQWADLVACKTRTLSLTTQGMRNGMLNFGLVFETALGAMLCYFPFLGMLGTRPLEFVHWLPAMPFMIIILSYDEIRKYFLRSLSGPEEPNWVKTNTYY